MPSGPRFQPASSSSRFALSTLNYHFVFFDTKRSGLLMKLAVATPAFPPTLLPDADLNALIAYLRQIASRRSDKRFSVPRIAADQEHD
jgi:hypothetical protein